MTTNPEAPTTRSALTITVDHTRPNPVLDVVIPVYNEESELARCVSRLESYLRTRVPYSARITIADNASTDRTLEIAEQIAEGNSTVRVAHLDLKGRGRALNAVWSESDAEIVAYMDVDLSTDLNGLMPLVAPIISGHSDLAIGSRLAKTSRVVRGPKREFISRSYNLILRTAMGAKFSDAQCGFKAIRTSVARQVLPLVADTGWFFDTELLVISERIGLRIAEVPVDWIDDPNSKVDIVDTAMKDLRGCWRVGRALASGELPVSELRKSIGREPYVPGVPHGMVGQIVRFSVIGIICTVLNALVYLWLHPMVGSQTANFFALGSTAILNTWANRFFTFGIRGNANAGKHYAQGLGIFLFAWLITGGSLFVLHVGYPHAHKTVDVVVLVVSNLVATALRFVGYRWVFRNSTASTRVSEIS